MMRCSGLDAFAYVLTLLALDAGCPQAYSHGCRRGMRYTAVRASYLRKLGVRALPTSGLLLSCSHVGCHADCPFISYTSASFPVQTDPPHPRLFTCSASKKFVMVMGPPRPGRSCWALAVGAAWMGSATRLHLTHLIVKIKWKLL